MTIHDRNILQKFTYDFCHIVETYCPYVIVSGFLAICSGRSRGTEDIDILIPRLPLETFKKLHQSLLHKFSLFNLENTPIEELYEYLREGSNIRYVYIGTVIPNMELKFAKNEIDIDNITKRRKIELTNTDIYFAPIECAIAYKEYMGSDKDVEDAIHLRKVYDSEISEQSIKDYAIMIKRIQP
ncbi:MAG: hypothetical protein ACMXYE_05660 [Candidatus Woesearchaeota archaeon]